MSTDTLRRPRGPPAGRSASPGRRARDVRARRRAPTRRRPCARLEPQRRRVAADDARAGPAARGRGGRCSCCSGSCSPCGRATTATREPGRRRPGAGRGRLGPMATSPLSAARGRGLGVDGHRGHHLGRPDRRHGAARRRGVRPGDRHLAHDHAELLGPPRRPRACGPAPRWSCWPRTAAPPTTRPPTPGTTSRCATTAADRSSPRSGPATELLGIGVDVAGERRRGQPDRLDARPRTVRWEHGGSIADPDNAFEASPTTRSSGPAPRPSSGTAWVEAGPTTRRPASWRELPELGRSTGADVIDRRRRRRGALRS